MGADVMLVENGEAVARQALRLMCGVAGSIAPAVTVPGRLVLVSTDDTQTLKAAAAHLLALHESVFLLQV